MPISGSITRIGHVRLSRDKKQNNDWLLRVPEHAIQAMNLSTVGTGVYSGIGYGTSFDHGVSVALWAVGGGTSTGGTGFGIFIGTGAV